MKEMKKFNEVYNDIISEGLLRKVGQAFKSKKGRNKQLGEELKNLLSANGFSKPVDDRGVTTSTSSHKDIKILFNTEKMNNEKLPTKEITIKYSGKKRIAIKQSDTLDEIAAKINKILEKVGSTTSLTSSQSKENMFDDYKDPNEDPHDKL